MTADLRDTPIGEPLDAFLRSKAKGGVESGNYRRNCERVVGVFLDWLDRHEEKTFADFDPHTFRRFARDLTTYDATSEEPLHHRNLTAGTVRTYYAQVSAYMGWCVREGYLVRNPAQQNVATEPLSDDDGRRSGDQQAWTDVHRRTITAHVDQTVSEALDDIGDGDLFQAVKPYRDRALVYVLCYSGVRGGELVADPKDDRRVGLLWRDVSLADSTLTVFSKNQRWSDRSLPSQALAAVDRYRTVLDPHPDWPVFPTLHYPSLYGAIRDALSTAHGWTESAVERHVDDLTGHTAIFETLREYDIAPPAMTTDGVRRTMRRLCDDADLQLDDKHGYLAPHGGRRGVGEVMVRQRGFTAAARLLDNSEAMVREHYSHIEAKDLAADAGSAFDEHDQ